MNIVCHDISMTIHGDLVYKFKKIVGRVDFSDQFRKSIVVTNVLDIT